MKMRALLTQVLVLVVLPTVLAYSNPSQFQRKIFDFKYPSEGLYEISLGANEAMMQNMIRAYGDFNNDLRTDYVAIDNQNRTVVYLFNTDTYIFEQNTPVYPPVQGCNPLNYYLYDSNGDYNLDITVWGINGDGDNCLYILLKDNGQFIVNVTNTYNFTLTTQPFLIEYNKNYQNIDVKVYFLIIYNQTASQRKILLYKNGQYQVYSWSSLFQNTPVNNFAAIPFSRQHWNTFADITNDCYPDVMVTNDQNYTQIEFWIYNSALTLFVFDDSAASPDLPYFNSFSLVDINYDAALDIVISTNRQVYIYFNNRGLSPTSNLCIPQSYTFSFNWESPLIVLIEGYSLSEQNIQFGDLNIDGYPQMMLMAGTSQNGTTVLVYENRIEFDNSFNLYERQYGFGSLNSVVSVGFFDILQNGIVDIIVNLNSSGQVISQAYYNNYLYQNNFYIKGYGIDGINTSRGSQIPGVSFYWTNSVGNTIRLAYLTQIPQTAYYSYAMPYVVTGLGRANNYIEYFTTARLGASRSWTPIIPNSQLAVFIGRSDASEWAIKMFIMPGDTLIYVVIVCAFILTILGIILMILKWKKKPKVEPLLADL